GLVALAQAHQHPAGLLVAALLGAVGRVLLEEGAADGVGQHQAAERLVGPRRRGRLRPGGQPDAAPPPPAGEGRPRPPGEVPQPLSRRLSLPHAIGRHRAPPLVWNGSLSRTPSAIIPGGAGTVKTSKPRAGWRGRLPSEPGNRLPENRKAVAIGELLRVS